MAADPNIFQQYLKPVRSVTEYGADMDAAEKNQLELAASRQSLADDAATRQAYMQSAGDPNKIQQALDASGNYKASQAFRKSQLEQQKTQSDIGLANAHAGNFGAQTAKTAQETKFAAVAQHAQDIASIKTPQDIVAYLDSGIQKGIFPADQREQMLQNANQYPTVDAFKQAATQAAIPVVDRYKVEAENSRNAATNATSIATNQLTNETHVKTTGMTQAGENARNASTIAKDYKVAGMDSNGNFVGGADGKSPFQGLVDEIGTNQTSQSVALARMSPGVRSQILAQVRQQYPDYKVEDFAAKNAAFKAYTDPNSKTAQGLQASNTALNHLDTLRQLAAATNNGNLPLFNKIANEYAIQTGQAAPKNMKDAALMVGPEVSKAVVGMGGVGERGDFVHALGGNYSPAQIGGTADTMTELLGGRLAEMERSYQRSTGRKDFRSDAYLSPAAQAVLARRAPQGTAPAAGDAPTGATPNAQLKQSITSDAAGKQFNIRPTSLPKAGDVEGGYRFKGGNASDPRNWEKP